MNTRDSNSDSVSPHGFQDETATMDSNDKDGDASLMSINRVNFSTIQNSFMVQNMSFKPSDYPMLYDELKRRWNHAFSSLLKLSSTSNETAKTSDSNQWGGDIVANEWFDKLYKQHNEDGRYYHTTMHLKEMLDYVDMFMRSGQLPDLDNEQPKDGPQQRIKHLAVSILTLATFFHDAVYDAKSTSNEKDSAILFQQFCIEWTATASSTTASTATPQPPFISSTIRDAIVTYILATEKHKALPIAVVDNEETIVWTDNELSVLNRYQELFLDIDMSVLGKTVDAYMSYANCIRKEYSFVDHDVYCEKRASILQSFLDNNKHIYLTDIMRKTLGENARSNLQQEINLLKEKKSP